MQVLVRVNNQLKVNKQLTTPKFIIFHSLLHNLCPSTCLASKWLYFTKSGRKERKPNIIHWPAGFAAVKNVTWMPHFPSWVPSPPGGSKKHETRPKMGLGPLLTWEKSWSLAFPVRAALVSIRKLMVLLHDETSKLSFQLVLCHEASNDRWTTVLGSAKKKWILGWVSPASWLQEPSWQPRNQFEPSPVHRSLVIVA